MTDDQFDVLRRQVMQLLLPVEINGMQALELIALVTEQARRREPVFFRGKEIVYDDPDRPGAAPGEKRARG